MFTRVILTLALVLPIAAQAEDMFRWRDARGRIHYSNDTEKVPEGAQVVTKKIGEIGGAPIGEAIAPPAPPPSNANEPTAAAFPQVLGGFTPMVGCNSPGGCVANYGLYAFPDRVVDFNRRGWFGIDYTCGHQRDLEAWLRDASTAIAMREVGFF